MWNLKDKENFERRRQEELERAFAERDEGLKQLHLRWASLYGRRLTSGHCASAGT